MKRTGKCNHDYFTERASVYPHLDFAENVAYNYKTAKGFVDAWAFSDHHREQMLDDFTHIGIGTAVDDKGRIYATTDFLKTADGDRATRKQRRQIVRALQP